VVVEYDNQFWNSKNKENSWICIEFQDVVINPTGYLLRSWNSLYGPLQNWKLEGSKDNKNWVLLDKQTNSDALNGKCVEGKFPCYTNDTFSYFKLIQIGTNGSRDRQFNLEFHLTFVEFSGEITIN
jgi:hypothetical protein